jgi:hypothetical protein
MIPLCLPLAIPALLLALAQAGAGQSEEDLYRKVARSTALIYKSAGLSPAGFGSGFLVDEPHRLVITARHVLQNLDGGMVDSAMVAFAQVKDGDIVTEAAHYRRNWQALALRGKVVYESVRSDMAILQLDKLPAGLKPLELAAKPARPGQMVHVIGNSSQNMGGLFSYCQGYVRNAFFWDEMGARIVATQAPLNKGDSGGPIVNQRGQVVGLAYMSGSTSDKYKNSAVFDMQVTGLGICVSEIREAVDEVRSRLLATKKAGPPAGLLTTTFQGQPRAAVHLVTMDKDVLHRIRVKAKGFTPELYIDQLFISPPPGAFAAASELEHLFTPTETKEYRLQVVVFPGGDIPTGPLPYTVSVEQVAFQPETAIQEPQLKLNQQIRKFESGKLYKITVRGKGFEPDLQIVDGAKTVQTRFNGGKRADAGAGQWLLEAAGLTPTDYETSLTFAAPRTADYRILVAVSPFSPPQKEPRDYSLEIAELQVDWSASGQLTAKDPLYPQAGPFKVHTVKLEAGNTYQIDLMSTTFVTFLVLEDSAGKVLMKGFDAASLNSQLVFRPTKTDTYRLVATSHQTNASGSYLLAVTRNPGTQPRPAKVQKKQGK